MMSPSNRASAWLCKRILAWLARRIDASREPWIRAVEAECYEIPGALPRVWWALSAVPMAWTFARSPQSHDAQALGRGMNARMVFEAMRRRRRDIAAFSVTTVLAMLVVILDIFVVPVYRSAMAGMGLGAPIPMRLVTVFMSIAYPAAPVVFLAWLLVHRVRYPGQGIGLRRALPASNVVLLAILAGMAVGFVQFARVVPRELGDKIIQQTFTSYAKRTQHRVDADAARVSK